MAVGLLAAPSHPATPYQATCGNCGASGPESATIALAAEKWNSLALRSATPEPVAWQGVDPDGTVVLTRNKTTAEQWEATDWLVRALVPAPTSTEAGREISEADVERVARAIYVAQNNEDDWIFHENDGAVRAEYRKMATAALNKGGE